MGVSPGSPLPKKPTRVVTPTTQPQWLPPESTMVTIPVEEYAILKSLVHRLRALYARVQDNRKSMNAEYPRTLCEIELAYHELKQLEDK